MDSLDYERDSEQFLNSLEAAKKNVKHCKVTYEYNMVIY